MVKILPGGIGNQLNHQLNNVKIQHAMFAAFTFIIVSRPEVLDLVGGFLNIKNKNLLLIVHGLVAGLVNYFASDYIFQPLLDRIIVKEGYKNKKSKK